MHDREFLRQRDVAAHRVDRDANDLGAAELGAADDIIAVHIEQDPLARGACHQAGITAVTALQALLALAMVLARESLAAYAVLYAAAFMRFMAAVITIINPNDEARLSLAFGWGTWILPVVTVLAMVGLVWIGARHLGVSWKTNLVAYVVATLAVSAVVGADMLLKA